MRVLPTLALLAALGLSVYNTVQVRVLRTDLATVKLGNAAKPAPDAESRARTLLREAGLHQQRAQELIRKGQLDASRREMQKSMGLMEEAARAAGRDDVVQQIRDSAGRAAERIEGMLSRSKEKGGTGKQ